MGFWNPVTNLREYISTNPPGTTFFLCLLTLALTFVSLSSYSRTHPLPNPDTAKDWNQLLFALAQFKLCERANANTSELASYTEAELAGAQLNDTSSPVLTSHLRVPLVVSTSSSPTDDIIRLHTTLKASQLNMGDEEVVGVTLELQAGNDTHTCLSLTAPQNLLLTLSLPPPKCPTSKKDFRLVYVEASSEAPTASQQCYTLMTQQDPTLTVMLTEEERVLAAHHLVEFSVCLFVVCLLLCCAASLSNKMKRRHQWNGLDAPNEPLINDSCH